MVDGIELCFGDNEDVLFDGGCSWLESRACRRVMWGVGKVGGGGERRRFVIVDIIRVVIYICAWQGRDHVLAF